MYELIELIDLLNINKLKASGLWEILFEKDSKIKQLCEGIHTGQITSEEMAGALLYPNQPASTKIYSLIDRLKERLINMAFLLDLQGGSFSDRQEAYFDAHKKWSAASMFITKNARAIGVDILKDVLKQSIHFEFTDLALHAAGMLRLHYGIIKGDLERYGYYHQIYQQYEKIWAMESRTENLYIHLASNYVNVKATRLEFTQIAQEYYTEVAPYLEESSAFRLHLCGRLIQITIYTSQNDYVHTAKLCEDAITFFRKKPFEGSLAFQVFCYQLMVSYIQLKEFDRGKQAIESYQGLYEEGTFNWFKLQEMSFLLAIHTKHYADAVTLCNRIQLHPKMRNQLAHIAEIWKIYTAYSYYLQLTGRVPMTEDDTPKFKIGKFMNDIPIFSKDKRGLNIPILIIQILFSILDKSYVQTIDRIEAIKKYCSRYLREDDNFRSNCFIRLLLQIPEGSFHQQAVLRRAEKYLEQLRSVPLEIASQAHEIEIIPYEDLWQMAIDTLPNKVIKPGKKTVSTIHKC